MAERALSLHVHLLPHLVDSATFRGGVAVVIDVLRATTTIAYALHAGISTIYPVGEIPLALSLADEFTTQGFPVLLAGEREGADRSNGDGPGLIRPGVRAPVFARRVFVGRKSFSFAPGGQTCRVRSS